MGTVNDLNDSKNEHAMACAIYGDCLYDKVQEGAKALETKWAARAKIWDDLIDKAVKTGFLGWGAPLVSREWLSHMLLRVPMVQWPTGLSEEEKQLLFLAQAVTTYAKRYTRGIKSDPLEVGSEDEQRTLAALKQYASLIKSHIAIPMFKDYEAVSAAYGALLQPLCTEKYDEPCSLVEAVNLFKGDLRRGFKVKTLDVDPSTFRVLPAFLAWISK